LIGVEQWEPQLWLRQMNCKNLLALVYNNAAMEPSFILSVYNDHFRTGDISLNHNLWLNICDTITIRHGSSWWETLATTELLCSDKEEKKTMA